MPCISLNFAQFSLFMQSHEQIDTAVLSLRKGFPTCGMWKSSRWYASIIHFFTKIWI